MTGTPVILATASPGERRVALLRDDRLEEAWIERPARPADGVGDLHRARVSALAPAMGGAFLTLAGGETGFLPEAELPGDGPERRPIGRTLTQGQILPVRITRAPQGGKGPRVTARLDAAELALAAAAAPPGGTAPRLLRRGPEAALRLALAQPEALLRTDSPALAARLRAALGRERVALSHEPVFDDALEAEFDLLAGPEVPLPGGGRILVHPTPALTAIDVDSGAAAGARDPAAQMRLNGVAVAEAARQIRLRNLAGAIFLDVAGLSPRRRGVLLAPLREALAADPLAPRLVGLTGLGFAEIVRTRVHPPLHEVIGWPPSPLTRGLAALRQAARDAAARPGRRLALRAAPGLLAVLRDWPGVLDEYAAAAGHALELRADPALSPGSVTIEEARDDGR